MSETSIKNISQPSNMGHDKTVSAYWHNRRIGITGAKGTLGKALAKKLRSRGALVVGLTHGSIPQQKDNLSDDCPHEWVQWECGKESSLNNTLLKLDVLVLNHGINPQGRQSNNDLNKAIEVNALSSWRLIEQFEKIALSSKATESRREIWVNTSEAEIQPALSPAYEISKRLIGQLVSLRWSNQTKQQRQTLRIRKLILGPFKSELNPIGLMTGDFVSELLIRQIEFGLNLIIVTPNPFTYLLMPLTELLRSMYSYFLRKTMQEN